LPDLPQVRAFESLKKTPPLGGVFFVGFELLVKGFVQKFATCIMMKKEQATNNEKFICILAKQLGHFAVFRRAVHGDRTSQVVMQKPRVGCSWEFFGHGFNHRKIGLLV
jgi:hypothetical protein